MEGGCFDAARRVFSQVRVVRFDFFVTLFPVFRY